MGIATTALVLLLAAIAGSVTLMGCTTSKGWRRGLAGALVVLAGLWLGVNGPLEGPVVWHLTPGHGVTAADLLVVPALGAAAVLALTDWRARSRHRADQRRL